MNTKTLLIATALERAINKGLKYDPGTQTALNDLAGKVLAVHCSAPEGSLFFLIGDNNIAVQSHYEGTCHCKLTGDFTALRTVAFKNTTSLANSDVYIEGNPGVLSQVLEVLKQLDIDWEEALGDQIGSIPAHFLAQFIHHKSDWLKTRAKQLPGYLREVLTEELRVIPSDFEAQQLYQEVSTLRSDTARLEARIAHIKSSR